MSDPDHKSASKRVVVGVGGGIAAYKAPAVVRHFTERGHSVRVIPTAAALEFVGAATFEALSGNPVSTSVFDAIPEVPHVKLGQEADLVVVAPATADLMARAAQGRADDLLTGTLLTARCPVLFVPAMHTEMWEHPATRANVDTLRAYGATVLEPARGRLTGKDTGAGRLAEPDEIGAFGDLLLDRAESLPRDLEGRRVVVSAGGTREALDPVRYLTNRSSGKQGYALARVAAQRGANVTLVAGNTVGLPDPAAVDVVRISSALDLQAAMAEHSRDADLVIMAAAVADYRPAEAAATKLKKGGASEALETITMIENPDVLAGLVATRAEGALPGRSVIVGFAAETGDANGTVLEYGRVKLKRKGCDLLVLNAVGDGRAFEVDDNAGWLLGTDGSERTLALGSKNVMASHILDAAVAQMSDLN
ncbi:bifunctional phosphopantothenoylcysteine decarboxylase/phosphopantothenate--cysteine ligase CoaBC [Tsukamurella sp. 8F]|uniref:bifunctional phosphopantothenoylcysteine decarboxylase/phosphopantothenate--cysteine ligase CoaBC n=1 Tax=unclassified Tsukamurella TaxID=2633480 RepID=UPI0023B9BE40|nr:MULTISPECIES: bifunctional phosphopantothenoylcysteine decarboxylase/phosphopantothenate--cysteine ligase CoaBC [unclassified Tsukamurella]MDF0531072.1 bifunctional phosphopantothenoylcysteine decarboxylase/phosphopantothenate--cysteine ligase CoaBC [Tsukamurella sp. 8J]MDF0585461.1 bifunctional phosphopantothenoylcysteine decarboxylase/phosphopantothenate--cysteine ligase CoaBC [Tsukamurella sp. 8F]